MGAPGAAVAAEVVTTTDGVNLETVIGVEYEELAAL
jgi:hypothetical protein